MTSGTIENIKLIPSKLSNTNINYAPNGLNIFETLCSLLPQQKDQNIKNILENIAADILNIMMSIPETNWAKKDANGNTILEWAIWSNSSKVMDVFYNNQEFIEKFVTVEKTQIHNFFRVLMEPHISDNFREKQIQEFKKLGLAIDDLGPDNHTALYNSINTYLKSYLDKYTLINNNPNDKSIDSFQLQIDRYYKIIENFIISGANPSGEADNILNLLVQVLLQIQENISKISDAGHKYLAKTTFKALTENVHKLVEKTLENHNFNGSIVPNNIIAVFGNKIWSIKQSILKTQAQSQKALLTESFKELKSLAEPIIEKIVKQQGFNPDIIDTLGSNAVAWLGEFGPDFLSKHIENMQTKPDVNPQDKSGRSPLDWYSDYNAAKTVEILVKNGGNVNSQCSQDAATAGHRLFLNPSKVNANKSKLETLEVLLNKENKPPFDPSIRMVGDKTIADVLEEKKASVPDYDACRTAIDNYTTWYNNDYTVTSLGQQVEDLDLYE
ncbi:MAG: hypothetical protein ACIPMY_00330 [Rickettsia endosymbiont of Pentastiridius leporinus]